jgi:hypothetical protein
MTRIVRYIQFWVKPHHSHYGLSPADGSLTRGPRVPGPVRGRLDYLMSGASWAAVIEFTRMVSPFDW